MPLLKFDIFQGRSEQELRQLLDTTHAVLVDAFGVPPRDRYQSVTQHKPGELILQDTGLGYTRSQQVILLTVVSRPRAVEQKQRFYRNLALALERECGLSPDDLIISFVENTDADWSFGRGKAEFLSGELH